MTLAYASADHFQDPPSLARIHADRIHDYRFHVHVKRYELNTLPQDSVDLKRWLMQRFEEKEEYLAQLKKQWSISHCFEE